MDLQKMLSQFSPEQLQQGMKQLGLNPDQMNMVNNMAGGGSPKNGGGKSSAKGGSKSDFSNIDMNEVNAMLKSNPALAKQLQQAGMLNKISEIFKK